MISFTKKIIEKIKNGKNIESDEIFKFLDKINKEGYKQGDISRYLEIIDIMNRNGTIDEKRLIFVLCKLVMKEKYSIDKIGEVFGEYRSKIEGKLNIRWQQWDCLESKAKEEIIWNIKSGKMDEILNYKNFDHGKCESFDVFEIIKSVSDIDHRHEVIIECLSRYKNNKIVARGVKYGVVEHLGVKSGKDKEYVDYLTERPSKMKELCDARIHVDPTDNSEMYFVDEELKVEYMEEWRINKIMIDSIRHRAINVYTVIFSSKINYDTANRATLYLFWDQIFLYPKIVEEMNSERNTEYLKMFVEERMRLLRVEFYNKELDKNLWIEWFYKYTDKAKKLNADNYEILARYIKMLAYKCLGEYFYYKNT